MSALGISITHDIETNTRSETRVRYSIHSVSTKWPFIVIILGAITLYIIHIIDHHLPVAVTEQEALSNTSLFSEERSKNSLQRITGLGPRIVGTRENRILAPAIITDELKLAQKNAHSAQSLLYEVQTGSGAYTLTFRPPFTNVYENIQNVVAMIEGSDKQHSILLNCHYDSVPTSDGASDDALSCAVMLELIRVLSKANFRLKHNVIFLFNGAEETVLHGSHLFLSHKWAPTARLVINLDSAGIGGRPILFQSGPKNAWLVGYYADNVPYPHGQVMGEEMFQGGLLPSDTDLRIFKEFGNLPGLDIAYIRNGYGYHTKFDKEIYIAAGCHQHLGDNILALLRALGNAPELENMKAHSEGTAVYFDFLGWFFVRYSMRVGTLVNLTVSLLSTLSVVVFIRHLSRGSAWIELAYATVARVVGMLVGILASSIVGLTIDRVSPLAMPWFTNVWLLFPLFWCPCLIGFAAVPLLVDRWRDKKRGLSLSKIAQLNLVAAQIPWTILLVILTIMGLRSPVVPMLLVLFAAIANLIIHSTPLHQTVHTWVWVYLAVHVPAAMYQIYIVILLYVFFVPSMGRSGAVNADLYIGVISAVASIYTVNFIIPLMSLVRKPGKALGILAGLLLIMLPLALYTRIGQPYKEEVNVHTPQRYWIMHTDRQFYNESNVLRRHETGYFVLNLDRNSPRTIPLSGRSLYSLEKDCEEEMYCGLPLYITRMVSLSRFSSWIPASPPKFPSPSMFTVKKRTCVPNSRKCTIDLEIRGPDRITVMLSTRGGVTLKSWSIPTVPVPSSQWKGNPTYFVNIVRENITNTYPLTIDFDVSDVTAPILDIGLAGNFVHHADHKTPEFNDFLKNFPDWTHIIPWISSYTSYVI